MEELDEYTQTILDSCDDVLRLELLELLNQGYSIEEAIELLQEDI